MARDRKGTGGGQAPERRAAHLAERSRRVAGSAPRRLGCVKSYAVKFWAIRPGKARAKRTYEVRWKVGHRPCSRTLATKAQAESFLSELRQAARDGQPFDIETGL